MTDTRNTMQTSVIKDRFLLYYLNNISMTFTFDRKDSEGNITTENVALEAWGWGVIYKDGTEFHQFDSEGKFHQFVEINQENIDLFCMYKTEDPTKRIDISCKENVQYFHFYRNMLLNDGEVKIRVYVFGWKNKDNGTCSYTYILPNDHIITSDHDMDVLKFDISQL